MRELGRRGGRANPKAKRPGAQRESLREFLRREVDPARVWAAIEAGLESGNDRDRLAASKLLLTELYEPAAEREREQADVANARAKFASLIEAKAARAALSTLVERGFIRPGGARSFEGVVMFDLRELAEWAATWAPRPVAVADVACGTCGKEGVRLVAEGEPVSEGAVYCATCRPEEEGEVEASSPPGTPLVAVPDPPADEPLRRRSLA
jgi:hypothetical protein